MARGENKTESMLEIIADEAVPFPGFSSPPLRRQHYDLKPLKYSRDVK
jgi:hypothetical protein